MNVRCFCGNETYVIHEADGNVLADEKWYDPEAKKLRCPKCENDVLPVELVEPPAEGERPRVTVDPFSPVARTRKI